MQERLLLLPKDAKDKATETKKFFNKLKKRIPKDLDKQVAAIHDEVFEKTDSTPITTNPCMFWTRT